jgi:hypothetical protein
VVRKKAEVYSLVSCAAAACHGDANVPSLTNADVKDHWPSSATHWLAVDPHRQAYAALQSPLAEKIVQQLKTGLKATEDHRCLACHTTPALADPKLKSTPELESLRAEGVSCVACHGEGSLWIHPHTAWKGNRAAAMSGTGFTDLNDATKRAETCAGCHIGAPANGDVPVRDMNHDMIAAGHPPLDYVRHQDSNLYYPTKTFENLQSRLLPHWTSRSRGGGPYEESNFTKAFLEQSGLIATDEPPRRHGAAYARLHDDRIKRSADAKSRTPWPEFADPHKIPGSSYQSNECWHCHRRIPVDPEGSQGLSRP